ncbi:MAG TPA: helix-turn-helix transcriptional regulator [Albitalea sp.]|jgi:DNA-binding CsgD family transcriptional regulator|nr:helix-turn-helix transcriptional regulator [Albitalea sp.]
MNSSSSTVVPLRRSTSQNAAEPTPAPAALTWSSFQPLRGAGIADGLLLRILDEIDYGLMLVTEGARVCFANHIALRECAADRPMRLQDGHVLPRHEREHEAYFKALASSGVGRRSMLTVRSDTGPASLAMVPMGPAGGENAVLLLFGRRESCEPLSAEFFAMAHHLTASETSVLKGLCNGQRPAQIAKQSGVAISTVRSHIGSIRLKTQTGSIGELVRTVTALPPIVPALNRMSWGSGNVSQ